MGAPGRGDERGLGLDSTNVPRDPRIVGCLAVLWGQWGSCCSWQPFFHRSPRASRTGPEYALGALRANGRPDAGFGPAPDHVVVDGISGDDHVNAAAAASGGRYYIAAESISGQARFGIGRFTPTGALDPGFGGGTITTTIGDNASPRAIAVRRGGKLLVAGRADLGGVAQIALVRYLKNGLPDPDFGGGDGVVTTKVGVGATALDVEAAKGGKVVVVGGGGPAGGEGLVLRYRSNGTLDQSFGTGGIVRVRVGKASTAFACEVGARGKIVVAGAALGKVSGYVARLTPAGNRDHGFGGGDGLVRSTFRQGFGLVTDLALQRNGKIVVAGIGGDVPGIVGGTLVGRLRPNGAPDLGFGNRGSRLFLLGGTADALPRLQILPNGKILVAGKLAIFPDTTGLFAARLFGDPVRR